MSDQIVEQDMKHRHHLAMLRTGLRSAVAVVGMLVALAWSRCDPPVTGADAYRLGHAEGYVAGMRSCKE